MNRRKALGIFGGAPFAGRALAEKALAGQLNLAAPYKGPEAVNYTGGVCTASNDWMRAQGLVRKALAGSFKNNLSPDTYRMRLSRMYSMSPAAREAYARAYENKVRDTIDDWAVKLGLHADKNERQPWWWHWV